MTMLISFGCDGSVDWELVLRAKYLTSIIAGRFRKVWGPCDHSMARPQIADGGDGLQYEG